MRERCLSSSSPPLWGKSRDGVLWRAGAARRGLRGFPRSRPQGDRFGPRGRRKSIRGEKPATMDPGVPPERPKHVRYFSLFRECCFLAFSLLAGF